MAAAGEAAPRAWVYREELREIVGPFDSLRQAQQWADGETKPEETVRVFRAKDRAPREARER